MSRMRIKSKRRICLSRRDGVRARLVFDYLLATRFLMSVRRVGKISIGTMVKYDGGVWCVANANRFEPITLERVLTLRNRSDVFEPEYVGESKVKKVLTPSNIWNDATCWLVWYLDSWITLDHAALVDGKQLPSIRILGIAAAHGRRW